MHAVAGANTIRDRQIHGRFNLAGLIIPVEQENTNKILDPFCFALSAAKTFQQKMQGLRPDLSPLLDGPGAMESHGPSLNQFEVMIGVKTPFIVAVQTLMRSQLLRAEKNLHPIRVEQHLHPEPRITARDGLSVLIHNDGRIFVSPAAGWLHIGEGRFGKDEKMRLLLFVQLVHASLPPGHLVIAIREALPKNLLV